MAKTFEKGRVVSLKSDGPKMTVEGYKWDPREGRYMEDQIICSWFNDKGELKREMFSAEALKEVD